MRRSVLNGHGFARARRRGWPTAEICTLATAMLIAALVGGAIAGCGAPIIERLHGEPKAADAYTKPTPSAPPVADAINRFIAAVRRGAFEEANEGLSRRTRMALEVRARTVGLRGVDLLRPPSVQVSGPARKLFVRDPIARFTLRDLKTMRVGERPWPANKPHDGRGLRWTVELIDKTGKKRTITLIFEGISWRIHNPNLATQ